MPRAYDRELVGKRTVVRFELNRLQHLRSQCTETDPFKKGKQRGEKKGR